MKSLSQTLKDNPQVMLICKNLQRIYLDKSIDINKIIYDMQLPIHIHLFITANFTDLMNLKYS